MPAAPRASRAHAKPGPLSSRLGAQIRSPESEKPEVSEPNTLRISKLVTTQDSAGRNWRCLAAAPVPQAMLYLRRVIPANRPVMVAGLSVTSQGASSHGHFDAAFDQPDVGGPGGEVADHHADLHEQPEGS
jgi:hypothetical protein